VREGAAVDALGDVIAGSQAMKDPAEEPLDGGASTHRWSHAPARGPRQRHRFLRFARLGSRCGTEEKGGSGENEYARVRRREPSAGFVRAKNLRDRRIQMNGYR
jgi:hypothetical protein